METIFAVLGFLALLCALWPLGVLSADRQVTFVKPEDMREYSLAAGAVAYKGGLAGRDPAGRVKPFVPGDTFIGIFYEYVSNASGAAGAANVRVITGGIFQHALTSGALTDVGKPAFATADDTIALRGHPDAFVGYVVQYMTTNTVLIRMKHRGETPPNGVGSIELKVTGHEQFSATGTDGATHGNVYIGTPGGGFEVKSILGAGVSPNDAEDGGIKLAFDAVAEIALASVRTINDCLPVDEGLTFEVDLCFTDKADAAAVDLDFGFGTALTTNSEANVDHGDMVQLASFHLDGNSDNILVQSDDNTTDVAAVDTTIDNDSATDVSKKFKIIVRPTGVVEFWIAGARVLSTTVFALLSTADVGAFVNLEKTNDDTSAEVIIKNLRVAGAAAA